MSLKMRVEYLIRCTYTKLVEIKKLKPNPQNPNTHSAEQLKVYAAIIGFQGVRKPVVISKRSGFVVTGHGLIEAAKLNNWTVLPVDIQAFDSDEQEYSHMVADNELQKLSRTNYKLVNEKLPDLGPDIETMLLGLPKFKIDPSERIGLSGQPQVQPDEQKGTTADTETITLKCSPRDAATIRAAIHAKAQTYVETPARSTALASVCEDWLVAQDKSKNSKKSTKKTR